MKKLSFLFVAIALLSFCGLAKALTPTFIESADGKRLVRMDDPSTDQAFQEVKLEDSGKTVCFVHGNEILEDVHAPPVLIIDDNAVRHTLDGVRLATFDDANIRHGKDGKVAMYYKHPDLCPDFQSDRLYKVNGPELSKAELVAALYALKPEIFKLTDEEEAEQKKAMANAAAEADAQAAADPLPGKWMVLNGHGPGDKVNSGFVTFGKKIG